MVKRTENYTIYVTAGIIPRDRLPVTSCRFANVRNCPCRFPSAVAHGATESLVSRRDVGQNRKLGLRLNLGAYGSCRASTVRLGAVRTFPPGAPAPCRCSAKS